MTWVLLALLLVVLLWPRPRATRAEWNRLRPHLAPKILQRDGYRCTYCRTRLHEQNWSIDHVRPLSRGGSNHPRNLTAACRSCNSRKGSR